MEGEKKAKNLGNEKASLSSSFFDWAILCTTSQKIKWLDISAEAFPPRRKNKIKEEEREDS